VNAQIATTIYVATVLN